MRFSVCTAAFGMTGLKKIIDTSTRLGYDTVELTAAFHLPVESIPEHRKKILGWIRDAGTVCSALHYIFDGTIRLLSTDSEMTNQSAAYLKQVVDVVYDMECPTVIVGSGGKTRSFEPGWGRETEVEHMAEIIRRVGSCVQEKGVILAVEVVNRYETDFLNALEEAANFTNMASLPNVRTMADTYHLNIEEVSPAETIRKYGYTLASLHLADSDRQISGDGHFDFASMAEALQKVDSKGYCSFEVFGLYPWKLWYDTFEESIEHMGSGIKYARSTFE